MSGGLPFDEWTQVVTERIRKQKEKEAEKREAIIAAKQESEAKSIVAFNAWNVEKTVHDRALELLPEISPGRGSDEESWKAVCLTLCYTDIGLREKHKALHAEVSNNPKRSLEYIFMGWSRKNHAFDTVTISSALADRFSKGTRMMFEDAGDGTMTIGGLGYIVPGRSIDGLVKPMSSDDKLKNGIFNGMCKKAWAACMQEAENALNSECGDNRSDKDIQHKREHMCLSRGLYKLSEMAEEDKENAMKKIKSEKESRMEAGKQGHLRWLERKDATRIKLPPEGTFKEVSKSKFNCGNPDNTSFRVIKEKGPEPINSATVVRRMGIGLKTGYAHATGDGLSADMKLSRKSLLKEGFVHIENFTNPEDGATIDDEARAKYLDELESNKALKHQKVGELEKRAKSDHAFKEWTATKEAAELAIECMQLLLVILDFDTVPNKAGTNSVASTPTKAPSVSEISTVGATTLAGDFNKPLLNRPPTVDEYELWRAVGYACKAIDRALLTNWIIWSAPLFGKGDCLSEWNSFKPLQEVNNESVGTHPKGLENARSQSPYQRSHSHANDDNKSPERSQSPKKSHNVPLALYHPPKVSTAEKWTSEDREAGLRLLRMLSQEHRRLAAFRTEAATEKPPAMPLLRRELGAEALPAFLHGHEGSVRRVQSDLAIVDGLGVGMLGGTGVGSELVMQWFVGEDDVRVNPALGKASFENNDKTEDGVEGGAGKNPENPEKLMERLASAHSKSKSAKFVAPHQPPYVIVLETCGIAGGKNQREGQWTRVLIDPPEPLPILSSAPGSSYVPISARAQGMGLLPPLPGETNEAWESDSKRLRGCVRLTGLVPNTTYCYRIRAFSRAGASPYSFGAFTTAAAPPPAPILALPFLAPPQLLSHAAINTGPDGKIEPLPVATAPDSVFLIWERRVDFRIHLLRLLRVFYSCTMHNRRNSNKMLENGNSSKPRMMREDADGIREYIDEDDHHTDEDDGMGGLFSSIKASRETMIAAINHERGLYNWLASCVANADFWPAKDDDGHGDQIEQDDSSFRKLPSRFRIANNRPATVLEVLLTDPRDLLMWSDVLNMFADDAEADDPLDLMLAGTSLASVGQSVDDNDDDFPVVKARFAGGAGHMSIDSQRKALLRKSQTLSRLASHKLSTTISRPLTAAAATMTLKQHASNTSRPASASGGKTGGMDGTNRSVAGGSGITGMLDKLGRRNSIGGGSTTTTSLSVKLAQPISDRGVRYSLLQCVSDGPRGQEWQELYLGARSTRRIDKLLPGTSYSFKVQSINGDNQGSLYSPQGYVTTALPCATNLRTIGKVQATSVTITWDPVSAANALTTMRAISMGSSDTGDDAKDETKEKPKSANPAAAADIDAVLQALLQRTKGNATANADKNKKNDKKLFASASSMVPIREGDAGVGVDITRVWEKYDTQGTGTISATDLRGLLTDLGAYSETTALVTGDSVPIAAASVEGAASSGPADWRVAAALSVLDPKNTGRIIQTEFADWWNSVDAALEKALAVKSGASSVASRSRPQSAKSSVTGNANVTHNIVDPAAMGSPGAVLESLGSAVIYILECRRKLTKDEIGTMHANQHNQTLNQTMDGFDLGQTNRTQRTNGSIISGRPESATRSALNAPTTAGVLVPSSAYQNQITPWTVVYMGPQTRFRVTDLLPNGDYQFRVTVVGRHAYSVPSATLYVILPPLAPFAPVIIKTYPRSAALRWYPGELSADKFEVQVKMLETLLPHGATVHGKTDRLFAGSGKLYTGRNISEITKRRLATSRALALAGTQNHHDEEEQELWQEEPESHGWTSLYSGSSTYSMITGLIGNAVYRVRVVAYNSAGVPSHPSVETQMVTVDTNSNEPLSVSNAGRYFVIECGAANADIPSITDHGVPPVGTLPAQDMVVGDVILFTEDVYVDASPDPDPYHPAQKKEVPESSPNAHFLCSRTIAATVIGDTSSHVTQGTGSSANVGSPDGPVPIGAAAKAFKANEAANSVVQSEETRKVMTGKTLTLSHGFKAGQRPPTAGRRTSVSKEDNGNGIDTGNKPPPPETINQAIEQRVLSLQVEWCTVSLARAGPYVVPHGAILKRKQSEMAHLDIYRCMWEDESGRWSLGEELRASYSQ